MTDDAEPGEPTNVVTLQYPLLLAFDPTIGAPVEVPHARGPYAYADALHARLVAAINENNAQHEEQLSALERLAQAQINRVDEQDRLNQRIETALYNTEDRIAERDKFFVCVMSACIAGSVLALCASFYLVFQLTTAFTH